MRKFKLISFLTSMAVLIFILAACSKESPNGLKVITVDELETFFNEKQTGFLVVTNVGDSADPEEEVYLKALEEELIKQETYALKYDVYLSNGKDKHNEHINPTSDFTHTEQLHFVKKGQVMGEFDLTRYEGKKMQEELDYFISLMKKHL